MSSDLKFRCPVCRAQQTLSDECRRCQADLRLVASAHRRLAWLQAEQQRLRAVEDHANSRLIAAELQQLAPSRLT